MRKLTKYGVGVITQSTQINCPICDGSLGTPGGGFSSGRRCDACGIEIGTSTEVFGDERKLGIYIYELESMAEVFRPEWVDNGGGGTLR